MFATLNLQLTSLNTALDGAVDLRGIPTEGHSNSDGGRLPFAALLASRTELSTDPKSSGGGFLPDTGNALPPLGPPKLSNALSEIPEIETPELPAISDGDLLVVPDTQLQIELPYTPGDIALTPVSEVMLVPGQEIPAPGAKQPAVNRAPEFAPVDDVRLAARSLPRVEPGLLLAQTATAVDSATPGTATSGTNAPVVQPLAESLLRAKTPAVASQNVNPNVVAVDDNGIQLSDLPRDEIVPLVGRTLASQEVIQRPETRVPTISASHSLSSSQLAASMAQLGNDVTSARADTLAETINTPVRDAAWGDKLGERVLMLTGNQLKTAEIKLTPADLGPLRVRVSIEDGAAHVQFHATHAVTREAIEQALPRLREMLAESGLSLGQTDVSEQGVADGKADREYAAGGNSAAAVDEHGDAVDADRTERRKTVAPSGLLDTFA
jgi:flagellar hook-length control protein FliK